MSSKDGRLTLKSTGRYSESEPTQDVINLSWEVDLDLPVKRRLQRSVLFCGVTNRCRRGRQGHRRAPPILGLASCRFGIFGKQATEGVGEDTNFSLRIYHCNRTELPTVSKIAKTRPLLLDRSNVKRAVLTQCFRLPAESDPDKRNPQGLTCPGVPNAVTDIDCAAR